jgi:hypothetical protein
VDEVTTVWLVWIAANLASTAPLLLLRRLGIGRGGHVAAIVVAFAADLAVDTLLPSALGATPRTHVEAIAVTPHWLLFLHWFAHSSIYSAIIFSAWSVQSAAGGASADPVRKPSGT